jgi:antitoxin (DNA-binding transcriptional repressor) of toxin-antitoxin stability system
MKVLTVRDIRLHWPKAEAALRRDGAVVVTRDGVPVARILPYEPSAQDRGRFDAAAHLRWLSSFWKKPVRGPSTGERLEDDRKG